jgi:predicted NAD-dependent protein-ADP-ribosyltransferase YbiA (DUF1768 family)
MSQFIELNALEALLNEDDQEAERLVRELSPHEARLLGREVKRLLDLCRLRVGGRL